MRNLKRVLSLTLASVMLLGMMVIGSSAATDYPDVDYDNDNVEAIEVLEAINVMTGYPEDGTFKPGNEVSRAEMARIMAALMDLEYDYYVGANPFTDMAGHWAEGYAAACAANGIIAGRTTTTYDPSATVTAVEAAAMLMRALGYFQNREVDYADGFEISTVRQAGRINLFDRVDVKTNEPMTRNDVAQLILNTLQSGMVEPDKNGTLSVTTPDGFTVATGATNYVYTIARNNTIGQAINDTTAADGNSTSGLRGFILDLGEQLYNGELKLKKDEQDVFGRPSRRWEFKGKEIGTYRKVELHEETYSVKVTGKMLYDLLGGSTIEGYDVDVFIDGVDDANVLGNAYFTKADLTRNNDGTMGATGKGVTTEVYVDTEAKQITIVIINTYLAKAAEDYNDKDDDLDLTVYKITNSNTPANPVYVKASDDTDITVSGEDFPITEAEKDDLCLVQIADGEIQVMWAPEILDAVIIDAFKTNTSSNYVVTDGTQYDHADTARYDQEVLDDYNMTNLKETTYNIILDQYGYLIGLEKNNDPDQYVFLTGIDGGASNLYATTANANVIHLDGTMATVKVDMVKSRNNLTGTNRLLFGNTKNLSQLNTWCRYTVSTDGVYTLKMIPDATNSSTSMIPTTSPKVAQYAQDVAVYNDYSLTNANQATPAVKNITEKRISLIAYDEDLNVDEDDLNTDVINGDANLHYVYGNDDTVYLNVHLDSVAVDDGDTAALRNRWIIDEVNTVAVGVKNVNIEVKDLGNDKSVNGTPFYYPDAEIYTLYNDKGIVIAAVTIGEDSGTASSYAYITGSIDREEYGHTSNAKAVEGKWTWFRNAIVDGEKTRLTLTGDDFSDLNDLKTGEWYEVKYTADGDLRRAYEIGGTYSASDSYTFADYDGSGATGYGGTYNSGNGGKFVSGAANVEAAMNNGNNSTVLLHDYATVDKLTFKNGTLYTDIDATKGFHVGADVKVVVVNANKAGTSGFSSVEDGYTGYTGLQKAIRDMNSHGEAYSGTPSIGHGMKWIELSAIMTNGFASVIVLTDNSPLRGSSSSGLTASSTEMGVTVDPTQGLVTANFLSAAPSTALTAQRQAQIRTAMQAAGYTASMIDMVNGFLVTGSGEFWSLVVTEWYKITVDGVPFDYVQTGGNTANKTLTLSAGGNNKGTGYITKDALDAAASDSGYSYNDYAAGAILTKDTTPVNTHKTYHTGYVEVEKQSEIAKSIAGSGGTDGVAAVTVTSSNGANDFVKYGGSITVTVETTANLSATKGSVVSLNVTGGGDGTTTGVVSGDVTLKKQDVIDGKELTFTITNITEKITVVQVATTDVADPHDITIKLVDEDPANNDTKLNALIASIDGVRKAATTGDYEFVLEDVVKGETYEMVIRLNGTSVNDDKLVWSLDNNGSGSTTYGWVTSQVSAIGATDNSNTIEFNDNGGTYDNDTITLKITVDDATDETVTITLKNQA